MCNVFELFHGNNTPIYLEYHWEKVCSTTIEELKIKVKKYLAKGNRRKCFVVVRRLNAMMKIPAIK